MTKNHVGTEFKQAFIRRTAEARIAAGYTQLEIGAILGLEQDHYKQYESRSMLPHHHVAAFCAATRVSVDWLFGIGYREKKGSASSGPTPPSGIILPFPKPRKF